MRATSKSVQVDGRPLASYLNKTHQSKLLNERAQQVLPGGSTRSHAYFSPYPVIFERGSGTYLWDVDGNRFIDYTYNGFSIIHGYAYEPIERAITAALPSGTAWVNSNAHQIALAEALCARIPNADLVRFTNTGTEATMLATKVARRSTGRDLILKSNGAYHGSYDDLEAGLYGIGELPGRTVLADFGDLASYERAFTAHPRDIAAVIIEPVLVTFEVVAPPEGFLADLAALAHRHGALVIVDDCLMFRLAPGGSAQRYGFTADLTCLGKFVGGGLPMGVVAGRGDVLEVLNPHGETAMYHGGSFNGNPIAAGAGLVSLNALTQERIDEMDVHGQRLRGELRLLADAHGAPLGVSGTGSVIGVVVRDDGGAIDYEASSYLHLATLDRGVFYGPDGEMGMSTAVTEHTVTETLEAFDGALAEMMAWLPNR